MTFNEAGNKSTEGMSRLQLRNEVARLRQEVERLRAALAAALAGKPEKAEES